MPDSVAQSAQVRTFPDVAALVDGAARYFVQTVVAAQAARGSASVVLTGGGTGIGLLERVRELASAHFTDRGIDWSAVDFYWGDERFVPAGDPERNDEQADAALLNHVPVDPTRVHRISTSDGEHRDAVAAAAAYAAILPEQFDLHLLGMGGEGHINSMFPHSPAVREQHAPVVAVLDSPKPPPVRVTLTLPAVRRSRNVCLAVSGEAKADAVAAAISGAAPDDVPAAGVRGIDSTVWLLDSTAAAKLG
jgi:6-phosphogluconolactonase